MIMNYYLFNVLAVSRGFINVTKMLICCHHASRVCLFSSRQTHKGHYYQTHNRHLAARSSTFLPCQSSLPQTRSAEIHWWYYAQWMQPLFFFFSSITQHLYPASELPRSTKTHWFAFFVISMQNVFIRGVTGATDNAEWPEILSQVTPTATHLFWTSGAALHQPCFSPNSLEPVQQSIHSKCVFVTRFGKELKISENRNKLGHSPSFFHYRFSRGKVLKVPRAPGCWLLGLCLRHQCAWVGLQEQLQPKLWTVPLLTAFRCFLLFAFIS